MIAIQRVYDHEPAGKGARYLVDRLWPRGIKKTDLPLDGWLKEVAPSTELRHWYGHDPERWVEFQKRYTAELNANPDAWQPLVDAARNGDVTLLFSSKELERNNAVALRAFLERKLNGASKRRTTANRPAKGGASKRPTRGIAAKRKTGPKPATRR